MMQLKGSCFSNSDPVHPPPVTVTNEGLGQDSLLNMQQSGGDWHPGWGVDPSNTH